MEILWWHWLVLGLFLVAAELATPGGFFIIFFGAGALVVGLLARVGMAGPPAMQLALFAGLSVGSLLLFRARLLALFQKEPQAPPVDILVGEIGTVTGDLAPGEVGRVELRGTAWSARNTSPLLLPSGSRCQVVRVDGLMLLVGPEGVR